jgi:sugar lactone lactonase YvrE
MERNLMDLKKALWVRTESLFRTLAVLALSLLPQVSPVAAAPSDVQVVESYDPAQMQTAENLAVDYKGNIYLSLTGAIAKRTPDGQQKITKLPIPGVTEGIALDAQGRVYVGLFSPTPNPDVEGVWVFPPDGGKPYRAFTLPPGGQLNGLTFDSQGNMYIADPINGLIYKVPNGSTQATVWLDSPLLKPVPGKFVVAPGLPPFAALGANGIKVYKDAVWVSNTAQEIITQIPIKSDGSAGTPKVRFTNIMSDDFAFDVAGNLYTATDADNEIVKFSPDGTRTVIAGSQDGIKGPSAVAFGRLPGDRNTLYITDIGIFTTDQHPALLKTQVNLPGYPVPIPYVRNALAGR